jgi:hypothetical protein
MISIEQIQPGKYKAKQGSLFEFGVKSYKICACGKYSFVKDDGTHWVQCKCGKSLENVLPTEDTSIHCELIVKIGVENGAPQLACVVYEQRVDDTGVTRADGNFVIRSDGTTLRHVDIAVSAVKAMGHKDPLEHGWDDVFAINPGTYFDVEIKAGNNNKKYVSIVTAQSYERKKLDESAKKSALARLNSMSSKSKVEVPF